MMIKDDKIKKLIKSILVIAVPIIIQGLIFQLQSLTDKAFLGNINALYLSAVGAAQFPFNTTLESLVALCTGVTILTAQLNGAGKKKEIYEVVHCVLPCNFVISVFLFGLWFFCSEKLLSLMHVDSSIIRYSTSYIRICAFYLFFLGMDASLQAMMQGMGYTKPILYAGIIKVGLNIFLAWILIFGRFGFPALHVEGAAIATTAANIIAFMVLAVYYYGYRKMDKEAVKEGRHNAGPSLYKKILSLGLPTCLEFFLWNFSNLFLVRFLNGFDVTAVAIYTVTFSIEIIVYMIFNGISKAALTLMGHKIGQGNYEEAKTVLKTCILLNLLAVTCFLVFTLLLPEPILGLFINDASVLKQAEPFLVLTGIILIPKSINVTFGSGVRAYGNTKWMLYTQVIGSILVITCSYVLVNCFHLNIAAVYITIFLDESIRAWINYLIYRKCTAECSTKPPIFMDGFAAD